MQIETFDDADDDDFVGCTRTVGFDKGVPWEEEEESKRESFGHFVEKEVRVVTTVAMMSRLTVFSGFRPTWSGVERSEEESEYF
ncbi:unnamed protein product [Dovyalis caffra]|uniref:Uncharacterized protein n=1 Tax=Dovyalis caffra TaxID=77055 RepID=A0AAV1RRH0_9ROSI|nr:unnamed protein product [Dovyalis caffra]